MCEKHVFSLLLNRTREARALCGFQHHKGENLFCFLFSGTISVGLIVGLTIYDYDFCSEFGDALSYDIRAVLNATIFFRILPPNVRSQEAARI